MLITLSQKPTQLSQSVFAFTLNLISIPVLSPGDAGVAEEERAVHRGGVSEDVQQQEHEGRQRAAQQRPGGGLGEPASFSACRAAQSMFSYIRLNA